MGVDDEVEWRTVSVEMRQVSNWEFTKLDVSLHESQSHQKWWQVKKINIVSQMGDSYLKKSNRTGCNCNESDDRQSKPEEGGKDHKATSIRSEEDS